MTANKATLVIVTEFHKSLVTAITQGERAVSTTRAKIESLITTRYGKIMPTFAEYGEDQLALDQLAKAKHLADNQHYRKLYSRFVVEIYGALPVSMDEAASKKRAQRLVAADPTARANYEAARQAAKGKPEHEIEALAQHALKATRKQAKQTSAGAPAGEPKPQAPSLAESVEQFIARVGPIQVLAALSHILESDKSTKLDAKTLAAVAAKLGKKAA
jgi:transcriptional antiterminator